MMAPADYKRFYLKVLALVALPITLIAGFNYLIDPYRVWSAPKISHVNEVSDYAGAKDWIQVARAIRRDRPKALIFGTSTSMQLDATEYSKHVGVRAYNAGMVMASTSTIREYFDMAVHEQPDLQHVLLALDFLQFNELGDITQSTRRPSSVPPLLTEEGLAMLFSKDGVAASAATLALNITQGEPEQSTPGSPEVFDRYLESAMAQRGNYDPYRLSESALEDLEYMAATCAQRDIKLTVVITPMHAEHLNALYSAGLGDKYGEWLRRVAAKTPVWDFSGYNHITTEPVVSQMKSYHDPFHYTTSVGTLMIRRSVGAGATSPEFGVRVTEFDVERHVDKMTAQYREQVRLGQ